MGGANTLGPAEMAPPTNKKKEMQLALRNSIKAAEHIEIIDESSASVAAAYREHSKSPRILKAQLIANKNRQVIKMSKNGPTVYKAKALPTTTPELNI